MKIFEIALNDYDGNTERSNHLVKWVRAPSAEAVRSFIDLWQLSVREFNEVDDIGSMSMDACVDEDGCIL